MWKMLRPYVRFFAAACARYEMAISGLSTIVRKNDNGLVADEDIDNIRHEMELLRAWSATVDLQSVKPKAERILEALRPGVKAVFIRDDLRDLQDRIEDELESRQFLYVSPSLAEYYTNPLGGWSDVVDKFPPAQFDIEESAKCFALGRHTACVFHLMRVMEIGLRGLAKDLRIPYAPSWESYIKQIQASIDQKRRAKGVRWRRDEPYFTEVLGDLTSIKMAWRNPTMHVRRKYTPDETLDIFNAVKTFMQRLAVRENAKELKKRQ
jgi:hypothetical protein